MNVHTILGFLLIFSLFHCNMIIVAAYQLVQVFTKPYRDFEKLTGLDIGVLILWWLYCNILYPFLSEVFNTTLAIPTR